MSANENSSITVRECTAADDSTSLHEIYQSTVGSSEPYALSAERFRDLLTASRAKVYIAGPSDSARPTSSQNVYGFALTYLHRAGSALSPGLQHDKGSLALLAVHSSFRNRGVGTALHDVAIQYLTERVKASFSKSSPPATSSQLQLGSIFPRIFPGLPSSPDFQHAQEWFGRHGWEIKQDPSIDLYREIKDASGIAKEMEPVSKRAKTSGWTFRVPKESDDGALLELQEAEFGSFTGWPDVFPRLLRSGCREDIICAFDPDGILQGATVAGMPSAVSRELLLWPSTIGSKCGVIACVGMSKSSQGSGAGIAMVAEALVHLASRGADGCFVDWVSLKGFYQKCGFEQWANAYLESWRTIVA